MTPFILQALAAFVIGALLYRLRGGLLKDLLPYKIMVWRFTLGVGTQASRAVWSVPTAVFLWEALHLPTWEIAALTVSVFFSMVMLGTGDYLDPRKSHPLVDPLGALRNLIAIAPAAYFAAIPAAIYVATGALHAQIYKFSLRFTGATAAAELGIGGLTWLTIAILRGFYA